MLIAICFIHFDCSFAPGLAKSGAASQGTLWHSSRRDVFCMRWGCCYNEGENKGASNDGEVLFVWLSVEKRLNLKSLLILSVEKHPNPCYYTLFFLFIPGFIPFHRYNFLHLVHALDLYVELMKSQRFYQRNPSQSRCLNVDFLMDFGLGIFLINPPETHLNLKIPLWKRRNIYKPPIFGVSW